MSERRSTPERAFDGRVARPPADGSGAAQSGRTALELARVDLRRGIRWALGQDFWVLYGLVAAVGFAVLGWTAFDLAREAGRALAAGESTWLLSTGMWTVWGVMWLFTVGLLVVDAVGSNGDPGLDGHYLTVRPLADVAGGKLLAAALRFLPFLLAPTLAGYAGLALGAGQPLAVVGGLAAAVVTVASAVAVGYPVGLALKGAIRRSETLTRLKPLLAAGLGVAYLVVMTSGEFTILVARIGPAVRASPLGWLGDLALVTTPGVAVSWVGVAGALALAGAVVAVGVALTVPAARYAWETDRERPTASETATAPPDSRLDRVLGALPASEATRAVAATTLRRVARSPLQLVFAAVPLVAAIPLGEGVLATGQVPWYAPWLVVWYGAWAAGAAVPLNPLGNQGATLPTLLSAPATGRQVVQGHVLAAALPAAPVTAAAAVGVAHLGGRPVPELAAVGAAAAMVVPAAAVVAAGVGSVFPRFEAVDFGNAREAVPPSKVAFAVFGTVLSLAVVAAAVVTDDLAGRVVAAVLSARLPLEVSADAVTTASWLVLAGVAVALPLAYRLAIARIDKYTL